MSGEPDEVTRVMNPGLSQAIADTVQDVKDYFDINKHVEEMVAAQNNVVFQSSRWQKQHNRAGRWLFFLGLLMVVSFLLMLAYYNRYTPPAGSLATCALTSRQQLAMDAWGVISVFMFFITFVVFVIMTVVQAVKDTRMEARLRQAVQTRQEATAKVVETAKAMPPVPKPSAPKKQ